MSSIPSDELSSRIREFNEAVHHTSGISRICSRLEWGLAACENLHLTSPSVVEELDGSWMTLCETPLPSGEILLHALEMAWGFTCPLIGGSLETRLALLQTCIPAIESPRLLLLSGVLQDSSFHQALNSSFAPNILWHSQNILCLVADLSAGLDAYLSKRRKSFVRNLRQAEKKILREGISLSPPPESESIDSIRNRILNVEARSWKYQDGESIFQIPMYAHFYSQLLQSSREQGSLRVLFASRDGMDLAYCFGALAYDEYRGFQMSYDKEFAKIGLGNALQWEMMQIAKAEGVASYDFGMYSQYKEEWADEERVFLTALLKQS